MIYVLNHTTSTELDTSGAATADQRQEVFINILVDQEQLL